MDTSFPLAGSDDCRQLFDNLSQCLIIGRLICSEQGRPVDYVILDVNSAYTSQTGLKKEQVVGRNAGDVGAFTEPELLERLKSVVKTGQQAGFEMVEDSLGRWFYIQAVLLQGKNKFGMLLKDITARKGTDKVREQMIEALDAEFGQLRALMEALPVGVWVAEADGKMVMANNAASDICRGKAPLAESIEEYTVYKVFRQNTKELVPAGDYPLARALKGENVRDIVLDFERFDGTLGTLITSAAAICDATGDIIGGVVVVMDISQLKQAEAALKESEQRALALVTEFEEADKNKNHFIGVLAHELRNPLASVTAGLSVLELSENKEQGAETKKIIKREVAQLCRLVDDLLDLTRITQNRMKIKKEDIIINQIVKNAADDMKMEFRKKGVHLWVRICAQPLLLFADPVRITQCIGNILSNALKFTREGGSVWLSLEQVRGDAVISVKDNGIGISPEITSKLFRPFTQADETSDRFNNSGLGLGLYVVKGIVDLHGGKVAAHSPGPGEGALFTIRLPLGAGARKSKVVITDVNADRKLRFLIIEDNRSFNEVLRSILCAMGHEVYLAYNGADGIKKVRLIRPDVVFCDIGLPRRDGYKIAKVIRKDKTLKKVFLVALTGCAGENDIEAAKKSGYHRHLVKPIDTKALLKILSEVPV